MKGEWHQVCCPACSDLIERRGDEDDIDVLQRHMEEGCEEMEIHNGW